MTRICNLKVIMYKLNITDEELSEKTNISVDRIRRLKREPEQPKDWEAKIIAKVLNVDVNAIWPDFNEGE